jgi:outer membrane protein OmpA-like peptidoglycan-associated protein
MNALMVRRLVFVTTASLALLGVAAAADTVKVEGLIKSRSGEKMVVQTSANPNLIVVLTDSTKVGQVQGVMKARRKEMSMAALIPGLAVKVEGNYDDTKQLVATSVSFKGDDLKDAQKVQAGVHETQMQAQQNAAELEKHNAELKAQNDALQAQQAQLAAHQEQIAANKAAVDAAVARFGQLDDYYIFDEVTVLFANGKTKVDPKYTPQLLALADKAKGINGYMVEVKGFASATGSVAVNQKLSEDRAANVTNILIQQGKVPLTRMLAPGAMGESEQVGNDKTAEGQAENRRVVVRVLQNKAVAGIAK